MAAGRLWAIFARMVKFFIRWIYPRNLSVQFSKGGFLSLLLRWLRISWEYPKIDSVMMSACKLCQLIFGNWIRARKDHTEMHRYSLWMSKGFPWNWWVFMIRTAFSSFSCAIVESVLTDLCENSGLTILRRILCWRGSCRLECGRRSNPAVEEFRFDIYSLWSIDSVIVFISKSLELCELVPMGLLLEKSGSSTCRRSGATRTIGPEICVS